MNKILFTVSGSNDVRRCEIVMLVVLKARSLDVQPNIGLARCSLSNVEALQFYQVSHQLVCKSRARLLFGRSRATYQILAIGFTYLLMQSSTRWRGRSNCSRNWTWSQSLWASHLSLKIILTGIVPSSLQGQNCWWLIEGAVSKNIIIKDLGPISRLVSWCII